MELHLFDFDGTLFKSPEYVPDWWDVPGKYSWFSHPISLTEPCVPLSPSKKWWIESTINEASQSLSDPYAMTIICTGRVKVHKPRVVALLERVGLKSFDGYYFNPNMDVKVFKTDVIAELHGRHGFKSVHIWENENQSYYTRFVERTLGIPCVMHTIDEQHLPYECDASDIRLDHKETPISNEKEILPESQLRVSSHSRNLELRIASLEKEAISPLFFERGKMVDIGLSDTMKDYVYKPLNEKVIKPTRRFFSNPVFDVVVKHARTAPLERVYGLDYRELEGFLKIHKVNFNWSIKKVSLKKGEVQLVGASKNHKLRQGEEDPMIWIRYQNLFKGEMFTQDLANILHKLFKVKMPRNLVEHRVRMGSNLINLNPNGEKTMKRSASEVINELEIRIARLEKKSSSPVFELEGHIHEGSEGDYYVRKRGDIKGITSYIESWANRVLIAEDEGYDWKIKYDYKHFFGFTASNGLTELELFCVEGECRSEVRQLELLLRKVLLIPRSVRTDFNK